MSAPDFDHLHIRRLVFVTCRTDRQNRQQPIQGILLKVTVQNFKESPSKLCYCFGVVLVAFL